ncbi:zf-HC2 domain-containing protein [Streptomyces sp. ODS28]|uniref:anti-sigma factor family protein n=1 Tax=Streptomyces sp. ODS28 TaxID=3136688 RepID=UPI0031E9E0FA
MTSTPFTSGASDTDEHPEVAEISALAEGLLSPERSSDVRAHLADCALCADVRTSLDEIRDVLGTLPGPPAMPAELAGRIDAALAAEALLDSTAPEDGAESAAEAAARIRAGGTAVRDEEQAASADGTAYEGSGEGTADRAGTDAGDRSGDHAARLVSRETERRPRTAAAAERPPGRPRGHTGPSRDGSPRRPRRSRRMLLAAAGLVGVLGIGGVLLQNMGGGQPTASGPNETALKKQVHSLLDSPGAEASRTPRLDTKQSPATPSAGEKPLRGGADTVPSCVRESIDKARGGTPGSPESPLATDEKARYGKGSGYLVVLPNRGGDQHKVDVYVVDKSCVGAESADPGKLLLERTYPKN